MGLVKKKWKDWYSKSCCTARPIIAATITMPKKPRIEIVWASAKGAFTKTLSELKPILAAAKAPPAAAIHSIAMPAKIMKYACVETSRMRDWNSNFAMSSARISGCRGERRGNVAGDRAEIHVLERRLDRLEPLARRACAERMDHDFTARRTRRDHRQALLHLLDGLAWDGALPHLAPDRLDVRGRRARQDQPPLADHREARAKVGHVIHDVRGEDHDGLAADAREEVVEPHALLGIQARGGLVHDDEERVADQRLRDAETLAHAAGKAAERPVAHIREVGALEQRVHGRLPMRGVGDPLQAR